MIRYQRVLVHNDRIDQNRLETPYKFYHMHGRVFLMMYDLAAI